MDLIDAVAAWTGVDVKPPAAPNQAETNRSVMDPIGPPHPRNYSARIVGDRCNASIRPAVHARDRRNDAALLASTREPSICRPLINDHQATALPPPERYAGH